MHTHAHHHLHHHTTSASIVYVCTMRARVGNAEKRELAARHTHTRTTAANSATQPQALRTHTTTHATPSPTAPINQNGRKQQHTRVVFTTQQSILSVLQLLDRRRHTHAHAHAHAHTRTHTHTHAGSKPSVLFTTTLVSSVAVAACVVPIPHATRIKPIPHATRCLSLPRCACGNKQWPTTVILKGCRTPTGPYGADLCIATKKIEERTHALT